MITFNSAGWRQFITLRTLAMASVFLSANHLCGIASAQNIIYDSKSANYGSLGGWPCWDYKIWSVNNGYPKDRSAALKSGAYRHQKYRVPIHPPVAAPNYGYYQTCWKQLPVCSRCFSCELNAIEEIKAGSTIEENLNSPNSKIVPPEPSAPITPPVPLEENLPQTEPEAKLGNTKVKDRIAKNLLR